MTLIDAYFQSNLPGAKVDLVMFGPADATGYKIGYRQVSEYVQKLGMSNKVKLLGSAPQEDLAVIYSHATIFAMTSLYESFGLTPLEAMACEAPVVTSNTAAMPEIYGNAALFADPREPGEFADHFNTLLVELDLQEQLKANARLQITKYNWQKSAVKTLNVLYGAAKARK